MLSKKRQQPINIGTISAQLKLVSYKPIPVVTLQNITDHVGLITKTRMVKKCENCGNVVKDDFRFCENCGRTLKEVSRYNEKSGLSQAYKRYMLVGIIALFAIFSITLLLNQGSSPVTASASLPAITSAKGTEELDNTGTANAAINVQASSPSNTRKLAVSIQGMTCGGCVAGIERKVSALQGIISVDVSLSGKSGEIIYNPSVIDKQKIIDTITNYGYPASEVSDTPSGNNSTTEENTASSQAVLGCTTSSCSRSGSSCGCGCRG